MDSSQVVVVISSLGAIITGVLSAANGMNRRVRQKLRRAARERDELAAYIFSSRAAKRTHNDHFHPNGDNAIPITPLPPCLSDDDDEDDEPSHR